MRRVIRWEHLDGGFVFSQCEKYSIVPMPIDSLEPKYFELWIGDQFLSRSKTILLCKEEADIFEQKNNLKAG